MIFVTTGSAVKGIDFTRLIRKMDEIARSLEEEVVMQIGPIPYRPQYASSFEYCSFQEALTYFERASLVVGHCGIGTILNALRFRVPIIVVPRRIHYGELNRDDHQIEVAHRIEGKRLIHVVYEMEELEETIRTILSRHPSPPIPEPFWERKRLAEAIKTFVR